MHFLSAGAKERASEISLHKIGLKKGLKVHDAREKMRKEQRKSMKLLKFFKCFFELL